MLAPSGFPSLYPALDSASGSAIAWSGGVCQELQATGSLVVDHSLYSQVGLLANRMGAITAINSNVVQLVDSGSPLTLLTRSQIGGVETLNFTP